MCRPVQLQIHGFKVGVIMSCMILHLYSEYGTMPSVIIEAPAVAHVGMAPAIEASHSLIAHIPVRVRVPNIAWFKYFKAFSGIVFRSISDLHVWLNGPSRYCLRAP